MGIVKKKIFLKTFLELMSKKIVEMETILKENLGEYSIPERVLTRFCLDEGGILGKAACHTNTIYLDQYLIERYKEYYLKHTFVHEYAHLVVNTIYPGHIKDGVLISDHGIEFRKICQMFGIYGDACSDLEYLSSFPLEQRLVPHS